MDWYKLTIEETAEALATDPQDGLTAAEATTRLQRYGRNELVERGRISPWRILLNQFTELMVIILIVAAVVSLLLGETIDTIVIIAIVILNAAIGFSQEYRAEQAMAALKRMAVPTVRVRRDGVVQEVSSTLLVPGDVVLLEAGNVIPADGRMLTGANLKVEEAALTGESEPVEKRLRVPKGHDLVIGDRDNLVYMGTSVTYGRGSVIVVETGMETELGRIAELIQGVKEEETPLQRRLDRLGKTLTLVAVGIIALVVIFGLLRHGDLETLFLTGISMAVAAVPEGLPAVVTITLALGSQRLLKRHALIRKLPAVETLGSVTVICSDKTGTLTENRMTVTILDVAGNRSHIDTLVDSTEGLLRSELIHEEEPQLTALSVLVRAGALCNDAVLSHEDDGTVSAIGDPTEGALLLAANRLGYDKVDLDHRWPRVGEVPFTSERKRMTTIHQMDESVRSTDLPWGNSPFVALSKGAVDSLIDVTDFVLVDNQLVPLTEEMSEKILQSNAELAGQGQRVLGVAFRFWDSAEIPEDLSILEQNEVFAGMVAMMDPPRPEARAAVRTAIEAGIRPIMITGDHPLTALNIAQELGIADDDKCITGPQLAKMSVEELRPVVEDVHVYARVAPEHKLNIVKALQNNGQVAAMTGDGVNDAPALKQAEIGVAMGLTGTDVAKEAAEMVLLDDNFATIVAAVEEGRVIFDNIRKFILYTLSSNAGELYVMLIGPFLGMPLPLRPLQILWVNLVTDGLPGLALAQELGEPGVMKRPPFKPTESVFSRGIGSKILWIGFIMGLVSLAVGYLSWTDESRPSGGPWQTMLFTTLVLAQMGNALAIRSGRESLFSIGVLSNRLMVIAVVTTFALQLALIYVPFLQKIFSTTPLKAGELALCLAASTVVFISVEIYKWFYRRSHPLES